MSLRERFERGLLLVAIAAGAALVGAGPALAVPVDCDVVQSTNITLSTTWTAENIYCLEGIIFVEAGATLTIEPGTVVRGYRDSDTAGTNNPGALVVSRGAKIRALGTRDNPIVFTDDADDNWGGNTFPSFPYDNLADAIGENANWGGLILLGYGYVATNTVGAPDATRFQAVEGLEGAGSLGDYGDCAALRTSLGDPNFVCDDDDSGTLNYVSVRYGGFNLSANNEINGITMGGVGRETDVDYVEVFNNKDDGIECFGGAVGLRHFIVANAGDDGLDYDEGWRGKVQFFFEMQGIPGLGADKSDKGGEHDGGTSGDASQPYSIPTIYNATYVGHGNTKAFSGKDTNTVLHIRDNAGSRYYNSAFLDFGGAPALIEGSSGGVAGNPTGPGTCGERAITAYDPLTVTDPGIYQPIPPSGSMQLELKNDIWYCIGRQEDADVVSLGRTATLPTLGQCSVTVQSCLEDTDCPGGETCLDSPRRWGGDSGKIQFDPGTLSNAALGNQYVPCTDPLPIRTLVRDDLSGSATVPDQTVLIDPRPAAGGPLWNDVRSTPFFEGFYEPTNYRGAFGEENWALGWSNLSRLGFFPQKGQVTISSNITTSQTWTEDNEYILDGVIFVESGATLTIEPGTIVRGLPDSETSGTNNPGALVVSRGGKINAVGTADKPIVFTDKYDSSMFCPIPDPLGGIPNASCGQPEFPYDNLADAIGENANWGGIILLGYGYVANNTVAGPDATRFNAVEGLEGAGALGDYGDCAALRTSLGDPNFVCDDDDSGTMKYVSVRFGGFNLSANNEINGITMGAVGRATDVDYVEVMNNKDDGIEFFGGAVGIKHFSIANQGDDGVDYDEGWRGKGQFIFEMQGIPGLGADKSDKGGEHDGGTSGDASQPYSIPTIYNATFVGHGNAKAFSGKDTNTVLHIRDNAGSRYYNSAFLDFGGAPALVEGSSGGVGGNPTGPGTSGERAITAYDPLTASDPGIYTPYSNTGSMQLELKNDTWYCIGRQEDADVVSLGRTGTLPTLGQCSVTVQTCLENTDCPGGETCLDSPRRWGGDSGKIQFDPGTLSNPALGNTYLACASPLPIRELVRDDLSGSATVPDQIVSIDPRPSAGSPLLNAAKGVYPPDFSGASFFEPAPFQGAFGDDNWTIGWTGLSRLGWFPACNGSNGVLPFEVDTLSFASDLKTMSWKAVARPKGLGAQLYDVLRSDTAATFGLADFVEDDDGDTVAVDGTVPTSGDAFYYLVRAENRCGAGSLGKTSGGADRIAP